MKCTICGRDLDRGQTYCLCGQNVSQLTGGANADYGTAYGQENPKHNSWMLAVLLIVLAALIIVSCAAVLRSMSSRRITDESLWETVTMGECSIRIPAGMQPGQMTQIPSGMTALGFVQNGEVGVGISVIRFTDEQKKALKRVDFMSLMKEFFPTQEINGTTLVPRERGDMLYVEIPHTDPNGKPLKVLDACYYTEDAVYEIEIQCLEKKYDDYKTYMLKWLDSFRVNG